MFGKDIETIRKLVELESKLTDAIKTIDKLEGRFENLRLNTERKLRELEDAVFEEEEDLNEPNTS